ncbi:hypothetical protein CRG98_042492 [Punica granatum]|uniref:Disease resistance protein RGA3 n=1 Tax=Punica granatum TaxID=22663 RepID=A0A2I0HZM4_PUNGR|nr:hypothetical protein CRG98_042492 [Punica granatum]
MALKRKVARMFWLHLAEKRQVQAADVKDWLKKLEDVVYDADDLLDDFSAEVLRRSSVVGGGNRILNEVGIFFSCSNQLVYANKMAHRVEHIRERIDAIYKDRVQFQHERNSNLGSLVENRVTPETYPYEPQPYVIGRDKDKMKAIEFLLNPGFEENVSILPIVGFGGLGKTTLARLVFNNERVKEYFELKLWVCVSTNFDVEDILRKILQGHLRLRDIKIKRIHKMEALPGWFQYLSNLENLEIILCRGLKSLPGRLILPLLTKLVSLELYSCPQLDFSGESGNQLGMPNLQSGEPTKLRDLEFHWIDKMKTLPWWMQHLTNLEELIIGGCGNLKALPEWFPNLTSLKVLRVYGCGKELPRRCRRNTGEDWPKISHIHICTVLDKFYPNQYFQLKARAEIFQFALGRHLEGIAEEALS